MKTLLAAVAGCTLLVLTWQLLPVEAQPTEDTTAVSELELRMREFFQRLTEQRNTEAFQQLLRDNPELQKRAQTMIQRTAELQRQQGRLLNSRRLAARSLGPNVVVLQYLAEYERLPVVWYVTFYRRPRNGAGEEEQWGVVQLRLETDLQRAAFQGR